MTTLNDKECIETYFCGRNIQQNCFIVYILKCINKNIFDKFSY